VTVEDGNSHLRVSDNFLLDFEGITAIRYLGSDPSVTLKAGVEILGPECFSECAFLCSLAFEPGSRLRRIERHALSKCSSLKSICLPASVEFLGEGSFSECKSLSTFTFESGSKLTRIEARALSGCTQLASICLPASVEFLGEGSFSECKSLSTFTFESGSKLTRIEARTLSGCTQLASICLPASVLQVGESSFAGCKSLSAFTFESGSKLTRIEERALGGCSRLKSIVIPPSITEMRKKWAADNSFASVRFQSALSLRKMMEEDKVDLDGTYEIQFVECDCELEFPGCSAEPVPLSQNLFPLFRLVAITFRRGEAPFFELSFGDFEIVDEPNMGFPSAPRNRFGRRLW
jgi:hypothetical protein